MQQGGGGGGGGVQPQTGTEYLELFFLLLFLLLFLPPLIALRLVLFKTSKFFWLSSVIESNFLIIVKIEIVKNSMNKWLKIIYNLTN